MAQLLVLALNLPGLALTQIGGFILADDDGSACEVAFRRDWAHVPEDDAAILAGYDDLLRSMASDAKSVDKFLTHLESTLSNSVRCLDRLTIASTLPLQAHAGLLRHGLLGEDQIRDPRALTGSSQV